MPNIYDFLRMQNIFNPPTPDVGIQPPNTGLFAPPTDIGIPPGSMMPPTNFQIPTPGPEMGGDIATMMKGLYTPETGASDRFNQMIGQYPQRESPSVLRRIAGALTAFGPGGMEAGMGVMEQPFRQKQEDWLKQIGPAGQAAGLERQQNVNERMMAYQVAAARLREDAQKAKETNDERKIAIADRRARTYEMKARGLKFDFSGPYVMVSDPISGKVIKTDIPTGEMSKEDQMWLGLDLDIERIQERGSEARKTGIAVERERQTGREAIAEKKGWSEPVTIEDPDDPTKRITVIVDKDSGETKRVNIGKQPVRDPRRLQGGGRSTVGGGLSPIQINRQRNNRARQLRDERPELAPYIRLKGSNDFEISPRAPADLRKIINDYINEGLGGIDVSQPTRSNTAGTPPAQSKYKVTVK